jgi:hypothetical protein
MVRRTMVFTYPHNDYINDRSRIQIFGQKFAIWLKISL